MVLTEALNKGSLKNYHRYNSRKTALLEPPFRKISGSTGKFEEQSIARFSYCVIIAEFDIVTIINYYFLLIGTLKNQHFYSR